MEGYRTDRAAGRVKGGAAIYLRNDIPANSCELLSVSNDGVVEYIRI